jgi:Zn-dependent protease with chaperone function
MIKEDLTMFEEETLKFFYGKIDDLTYIVLLKKDSPKLICEFSNENDYKTALSTFEKTINITTYFNFISILLRWRNIKDKLKIIQKGSCKAIMQDPSTYVINDIKGISGVKNDSNLIIRFDPVMKGKTSTITNEPTNKYKVFFRMNKEQEIQEATRKQFVEGGLVGILQGLAITLVMILGMLFIYTSVGKRDRKLEKELKEILKDGKDWKVYIIKEASPNAFCIITPRMFVHSYLVEMMSHRELMSVLLHEAGHINNHDVYKTIAASNGLAAVLLAIIATSPAGIVLYAAANLYQILVQTGLSTVLFRRIMGRYAEKAADSYAAKYGYGPDMISALQKLDSWVKGVQSKRPCGVACNLLQKAGAILDEHPPVKERVENVLKDPDTWEKMKDHNFLNKVKYMKSRLLGE